LHFCGCRGYTSFKFPIVFYNDIGEFDVSLRIVHPDGDTVRDFRENFISIITIPWAEAYIVDSSRLCEGDTATLTVNVDGDISWLKYSWNPYHKVTESGSYSANIFQESGCYTTVFIDVEFFPSPDILITGDTLICEGETGMLTAGGGEHYEWSTGATEESITFNSEGVYSVYVEDTLGCRDTAEIAVEVRDLPEPLVSGSLEVCEGDSSRLIAGGGQTYRWSTGESADTIYLDVEGPYYLVASDEYACSDTLFFDFIRHPLPLVSITGDPGFCEGDSTMLMAHGGTSYSWPELGLHQSEVWVHEESMIRLIATDDHNCSDTAWHSIEVYEVPQAVFSEALSFDTAFFLNESTEADSCFWSFGDNTYSSESQPMHKYGTTGTFHVLLEVISDMGCKDRAVHDVIVVKTWLEEISIEEGITIFPNPVDDHLSVNWEPKGELPKNTDLRITDMTGKQMRIINIDPGLTVVNINDLRPGTYLLLIRKDKSWLPTGKFIKH
jgi:hypothetical protein